MAKRLPLLTPDPLLAKLLRAMEWATIFPPIPGMHAEAKDLFESFKEFLVSEGIDPEKK